MLIFLEAIFQVINIVKRCNVQFKLIKRKLDQSVQPQTSRHQRKREIKGFDNQGGRNNVVAAHMLIANKSHLMPVGSCNKLERYDFNFVSPSIMKCYLFLIKAKTI